MKPAGFGLSCCTRSWPPLYKLLETFWVECVWRKISFSQVLFFRAKLCVFGAHKDLFVFF